MASVLLNVKEGAAKEIATVAKTLASLSSELRNYEGSRVFGSGPSKSNLSQGGNRW